MATTAAADITGGMNASDYMPKSLLSNFHEELTVPATETATEGDDDSDAAETGYVNFDGSSFENMTFTEWPDDAPQTPEPANVHFGNSRADDDKDDVDINFDPNAVPNLRLGRL